ncbi:hypothetical protein ACFIJ5_01725 [Haloimpatiens sp. FM7330]|uniref:hypothetical protein n=1 Tax=Haloimpatiens sp. FM7330 TaxID=3298610 RepID=UPI0036437719
MTRYSLNIDGNIQLSDYTNISDYIQFLKENDEIIINIKSRNKVDSDTVYTMLKNSNFNVIYEGGREHETYCIKAYRN